VYMIAMGQAAQQSIDVLRPLWLGLGVINVSWWSILGCFMGGEAALFVSPHAPAEHFSGKIAAGFG